MKKIQMIKIFFVSLAILLTFPARAADGKHIPTARSAAPQLISASLVEPIRLPRLGLVEDAQTEQTILVRRKEIFEVFRSSTPHDEFKIFEGASLEPLVEYFAHHCFTGDTGFSFLQRFAERVKLDNRSGSNNTRIMHVCRTLCLMDDLLPRENDQPQRYSLVEEARYYAPARDQRNEIYQYLESKEKDILSDENFEAAQALLKGRLGKSKTDALDYPFSFTTAMDIVRHQRAMLEDNRTTHAYCVETQKNLLAMANREECQRRGIPWYTIRVAQKDGPAKLLNLAYDWQLVEAELKRIQESKMHDLLRFNVLRMTAGDQYSSFFQDDLEDLTPEQGRQLRDEIIRLLKLGLRACATPQFQVELDAHRRDPDRVYFKDDGGDITGIVDALYSVPKGTYDGTFVHLIRQAKIYFDILNVDGVSDETRLREKGDMGLFRARAKLLLEKGSASFIPPEIPRFGDRGFNKSVWVRALEDSRVSMAQYIVISLEGCDSGKDTKLYELKRKCQDSLGTREPRVRLLRGLAQIIADIKEAAIADVCKNPDKDRVEENRTKQHTLYNRLKGPFCLLGLYMPVNGAYLGRPEDEQNNPVQIARNLFLPGQPPTFYYTGPMPKMGDPETGPRIEVPVKPCLTIRDLVETVYNNFGTSTLSLDCISEFSRGRLELLEDERRVIAEGKPGIFFNKFLDERVTKERFTRALAVYLLVEANGYLQIDPVEKQKLYTLEGPVRIRVDHLLYTLEQLIEKCRSTAGEKIRVDGKLYTLQRLMEIAKAPPGTVLIDNCPHTLETLIHRY